MHTHLPRRLFDGDAVSDADVGRGVVVDLAKRDPHDRLLQLFKVELRR